MCILRIMDTIPRETVLWKKSISLSVMVYSLEVCVYNQYLFQIHYCIILLINWPPFFNPDYQGVSNYLRFVRTLKTETYENICAINLNVYFNFQKVVNAIVFSFVGSLELGGLRMPSDFAVWVKFYLSWKFLWLHMHRIFDSCQSQNEWNNVKRAIIPFIISFNFSLRVFVEEVAILSWNIDMNLQSIFIFPAFNLLYPVCLSWHLHVALKRKIMLLLQTV